MTTPAPLHSEASERDAEADRAAFWAALHARHPPLGVALAADARVYAMHRGERYEFTSRWDLLGQMIRLAWVSDAFLAQALYRAGARARARRIPLLAGVSHRLSMALAQVSIGAPVVMAPGVYIVHGQVVIDGLVEIGTGTVLTPFVTIGLRAGDLQGPTLEEDVSIGTGAKLIGPIRVGRGARVGANAVVVSDVEAHSTVAGAPARPVSSAS